MTTTIDASEAMRRMNAQKWGREYRHFSVNIV